MKYSGFEAIVRQMVMDAIPEIETVPYVDGSTHHRGMEVRLSLPDSMDSPVYDLTYMYDLFSVQGEDALIQSAEVLTQKLVLAEGFAKKVRATCLDYTEAKPRLRCTAISKAEAHRNVLEKKNRSCIYTGFGGDIALTYGLEYLCPNELDGVLGGDRIIVPVDGTMLSRYDVSKRELDQIARIRSAAFNPFVIQPVEDCDSPVWSVRTKYYPGAAAIAYPTFYTKVSRVAGKHFYIFAVDRGWLFIMPGNDPAGLQEFIREEYENTPEEFRLSRLLWVADEKGIRTVPDARTMKLSGRIVC